MTKIKDIIKTLNDNPVLFDRVTVRCIIQFIDNTTIKLTDFNNLIAIDAIQLLEFIKEVKEYKIPCRPRPNPPPDSIVVSIIDPVTNKVLLRAEETVDFDMYYMQFFYMVTGTGRILEENSNRFRSLREHLTNMLNESFDSYSSVINICQTTLSLKLIEARKMR